jgi:hypothetical protein
MKNQTETNEQRITRLLGGDLISDEARDYITSLVKIHGLGECAMLTGKDQIGLSVFEDDHGNQTLHYDGYGNGREYVEAGYCEIKDILDAAESGDEVPDWWPEDAVVISVHCKWNGYGSRLTTKGSE